MPSRRRSRERALQMIFQWEASGADPDEVVTAFFGGLASKDQAPTEFDPFAARLFRGVASTQDGLDETIRLHAANWKVERMSAVDRNLLRLALYEMNLGETARAVIIDEALEIGRRFSGDESTGFLNGILDAAAKTPGE